MICFVCGAVGPCGAYRLGGPGIVKVYLCDDCGRSLDELMATWLDQRKATPQQLPLFGV